jgi:leucyl-tRNA synthetase
MVTGDAPALPEPGTPAPTVWSDDALALRRAVHRAIAAVTVDLDGFHFNGAVAQIYQLANALAEASAATADQKWARREGFETIVKLAGPMMPHLCEELWQQLGHAKLLVETAWPVADPALVVSDRVTLAVQVEGRLRATIAVARDAPRELLEQLALGDDKVQKAIAGRTIRKVVVVPNRIVNVVV